MSREFEQLHYLVSDMIKLVEDTDDPVLYKKGEIAAYQWVLKTIEGM